MPFLLAVPVALAAVPAGAHAGEVRLEGLGCGGTGGPTGQTFANNRWTVPAGVESVTVTVQGGQGGSSTGDSATSRGGRGARLVATFDVFEGNTYYACVGAGAGQGGTTGGSIGGGYSSLSRFSDHATPTMVAGGGGGSGATLGGGHGGDGGDAGVDGVNGGNAGNGGSIDSTNGGGGAQLLPAVAAGAAGTSTANAAHNGSGGLSYRGGRGGNGLSPAAGGGGGGAGAFGGGGGAGMYGGGASSGGAGGGGGTSACTVAGCAMTLESSGPYVLITWSEPPTTTTASIDEARIGPVQFITYRATVAPAVTGGTVDFRVDGVSIYGCNAVPLVTGRAECPYFSPNDPGDYELTTTYSGTTGHAGSHDSETFHVDGPDATIEPFPTAKFGEVALDASTTRPVTVRNSGDGDLVINGITGVGIGEYVPAEPMENTTDFTVLDDQCTDRTLAPGASCVITVTFIPTALGERLASLWINSNDWNETPSIKLIGMGVEPAPEPEPEQPKPEQPKPDGHTPQTPQPQNPTPAPRVPNLPAPPTQSAPPDTTPDRPEPRAVGASANVSASKPPVVTKSNTVRLPLVCPVGQPCSVSGTLTLALRGGQARAAQSANVRVLARFSGIRIAAGRTRNLSLRLPASFVKAQQAKGVRTLRTTLTVRTTLGSGQTVTRRQAVTIRIPQASAAQRRAAPAPAPRAAPRRPSFTG